MSPFEEKVQAAFFVGMANGYANDVPKTTILEFPESRVITHVWEEFQVTDCYFSNPMGKSAGTTTIWMDKRPVWFMSYGGWYEKGVVPFLKRCLLSAYSEPRFYGGRGPHHMREGDLIYTNVTGRDNFSGFSGGERICNTHGHLFGCHWYHGMMLA